MKSINISLNTVTRVKSFVNIVSSYNGSFDLISDRYIIDAKSIMGIFSLDLSQTIRLDIHNEDIYEDIKLKLQDFIVE